MLSHKSEDDFLSILPNPSFFGCSPNFYIDICSISDADSFLLWKGNDFMLVDTGRLEDGPDIIGLLIKRQISMLKALVITHYDSDHIGSYLSIIDYMNSLKSIDNPNTIEHIYARKYDRFQLEILPPDRYENYIKFINGILRYQNRETEEFDLAAPPDVITLEKKANQLFNTGKGLWIFPYKTNLCSNFTLDRDVTILWLNQKESYLLAGTTKSTLAGNINNDSLVFKAIYSGKSALFLGDMGRSGLRDLLLYSSLYLQSDILKISHHGHKYSSPKYFIEEVNPSISFVTTTLDSPSDNNAFTNRLEELTANHINFGSLIYSGSEKDRYSSIIIRVIPPQIYTKSTSIIGYRY